MTDADDPMIQTKAAAAVFKVRLADIRAPVAPPPNGLPWYPHVATVENFWLIDQLLTGSDRALFSNLAGKVTADIGGADGDMAFLLETFGASVDLIDHPSTSNNALEGARTLKRELNSTVQIHEIDVDEQFVLPRRYDFVLLLGILYHLKNPFYVLEHLARSTKHLFLSTRLQSFPHRLTIRGECRLPVPWPTWLPMKAIMTQQIIGFSAKRDYVGCSAGLDGPSLV